MAGYKDRLKRLNEEYRQTKPAKPSGFVDLPQGTYQFIVSTGKMVEESKARFALGEIEVQIYATVLTGEYKGAKGRMNFFLEQPAKRIGNVDVPSGMSQFKGFIDGMGISMPEFSDKAMLSALRELKGMKFNGYCTGKYNNVRFNSPLDTDDLEIDDNEFEDDAGDEAEAESTRSEEAEKPAPKKPTKAKPQVASKSSEGSEDDDEEFDFDDF